MGLTSTTCRNNYTGDGSTTVFAYGFKIFVNTDLLVTVRSTAGVETTQVLTTNYTVSGVLNATGGNVTFVTAPASGAKITIRRVRPLTQTTDIKNQGDFYPETHEDTFDKVVMLAQQLQDQATRAIKNKETDTLVSTDLPLVADRASKFLAFDSSGVPMAASSVSSAPVTTFMATVLDDTTAAQALTTLGFSAFIQTLIDDLTAGAALTTLGVSAFIQTLLDDASAAVARTTLQVPYAFDYTTTATAAGTSTLTSASGRTQFFTGATTQTVVLPDATTLTIGDKFYIVNLSSGLLTVNKNGGTLQQTMYGDSVASFTVTSVSTAAGTWSTQYSRRVIQAPTVQKFTSGSGTYTTPVSPAPTFIRVRMVGGGGGGAGSGSASGTLATAGGNSTFGTTLLVSNGGSPGLRGDVGGAGGTASLGSGPVGLAISGSAGAAGAAHGGTATCSLMGGNGGTSALGGAGSGSPNAGTAPSGAAANSGSGGGGCGISATINAGSGAGGGAGGFVDAIITSPLTTYAYAVGAAGSAGAAGTSGGAGAAGSAGVIIVEEYYQ